MSDPLQELDPIARRTVQGFMDMALKHSATGMAELFAKDCEFTGALTAGKLRGRKVIEAHYRQVFKSHLPTRMTVLQRTQVHGRQVVLDWEIQDTKDAAFVPALGRTTLSLDDLGLISSIKTEWSPRQARLGKG